MGIFDRKKGGKCSLCGRVLKLRSYFEGKKIGGGGKGVGDMERMLKSFEEMNSAAYKCRKCGTLVCRGCIGIGESCPKCGGIIFDSVEDESQLSRS